MYLCVQFDLICTVNAGDNSGMAGFVRLGRCAPCKETGEWVPKVIFDAAGDRQIPDGEAEED